MQNNSDQNGNPAIVSLLDATNDRCLNRSCSLWLVMKSNQELLVHALSLLSFKSFVFIAFILFYLLHLCFPLINLLVFHSNIFFLSYFELFVSELQCKEHGLVDV